MNDELFVANDGYSVTKYSLRHVYLVLYLDRGLNDNQLSGTIPSEISNLRNPKKQYVDNE